jgi:CelD/BcsL family acetyltransferase involved in cellulose biosynthesis
MTSGELWEGRAGGAAQPAVAPAHLAPAPTTGEPPTGAGPRALRTIVYGPDSTPNGFAALQAEWNRLLRRSRFDTLFLTHEWQTTWWESLGEGELWILAMRSQATNELVGIVPLYLVINQEGPWAGKRKFNLVGCIEVSDYLDIIAAKGWERDVYRAFHAWLCSDAAPAWEVLDLCNLPEDSLTYRELPAVFSEITPGWEIQVSQEDTAPQFALPLRYDTYLQERVEKKQRHEIRRKQRRAERETEVQFTLVGPKDNLAAEMDDFAALQRASRPDKAEFMTPEMRRFFQRMAQRMQDAGYLRLGFLSINGEKAAALLSFEYNRRFLLYNSGYDPDAYSHLSPGWVLVGYTIQYALAVGCRVFDFMQGGEAYKYHFGSQDYRVMRVIVTRQG